MLFFIKQNELKSFRYFKTVHSLLGRLYSQAQGGKLRVFCLHMGFPLICITVKLLCFTVRVV